MNNKEGYIFWRLAYLLIADHGYRMIQLFENQKELWLEKFENKHAPIIRMLLHDLNWSNSMQRDIEFTAANGERVRGQIGRREINVVNIYVSQYPPVDDYEYRIAKPYVNPNSNKTTVRSIILAKDVYNSGFSQISTLLQKEVKFSINEDISETEVDTLKRTVLGHAIRKAKTERAILMNGKPFYTYLFIFIQVVVYFWLEMHGGSTNTSTLLKYGAKFNPYIHNGEWWRFITPIFLHIGLGHLAMNSLSLYFLGTAIERIYGNLRFLFIYLFAGAAGFIGSFLFSDNISAGASGAIFGCAGALLYFGLIYPKLFSRTMGPAFIIILLLNLFFGFAHQGIDNAGHIGGLIGGFLASGIVYFPKKKKPLTQLIFLIVATASVWGTLFYGFSDLTEGKDEQSNLIVAQEYIKQENYEQAYQLLKEVEKDTAHPSEQVYFLLSFVEIKQRMLEDAQSHLLRAIQLNPEFTEAHYNLALIYLEKNDFISAKKYADKAAKLNPNKKEYAELVKQINQFLQPSGESE